MGGHGHYSGPSEPLAPITAADEQYSFTPEGSGYEHTDANVWQITKFGIWLVITAVVVHVGGLWITSPPDMLDALTFVSPTPFSPFGVITMWAIFAVALLAAFRRRLGLRRFRIVHMALAAVIVVGTVVHAALIEGTMETVSKASLCMLVLGAATKVIADLVRRLRAASRRQALPDSH